MTNATRTMRTAAAFVFGLLAAVACAITLVSTVRSNEGWIRVLDFPRLLALISIIVIAIGCAIFLRRFRWPVVLALMLAAGWQCWRIYPYMPLAAQQVPRADEIVGIDPRSCFSVFGLNVLQSNRNYAATIAAIQHEQPDVLLLMETDDRWLRALAPVLSRYPHRLLRPISNTYGMLFVTRLPVESARMLDITDHETPTLYATLRTRDGQRFNYIGLHPRPPLPGQDTGSRDAKIERAAVAAGGAGALPAVAMGDFNDVPWSYTTGTFRRAGHFLDPRIGRGSYPTFPADYAVLGWPLDQLFVTSGFTFRDVRVLENVGSDHRPLAAELCLRPDRQTDPDAAAPRREARSKARRAVDAID